MDYGKLAYLKSEELEARLNTRAPQSRAVRKSIALSKTAAADESVFLAVIKGTGSLGLIVNLSFDGQPAGEVYLWIDGKRADCQTADKKTVFMASVTLNGAAEIAVGCSQAAALSKAEIMAIGDADFTAAGGTPCALDAAGDKIGFAEVVDSAVRLYITNLDAPTLDTYKLIGFGEDADIAGCYMDGRPCFAVVVRDKTGNVFMTVFDTDYNLKLSKPVVSGQDGRVTGVTLARAAQYLAVGFVKNSFAYAALLDPARPSVTAAAAIDAAERVSLIKNADPPIAVLMSKDKNRLRVSEREATAIEHINIKATVTVA